MNRFYSVATQTLVAHDALGDTINIGARLQAEAAAGELVVSDAVYASVRLPAAESRTVTLKGKTEPMELRVVRAN
jgi:adenylate cyclase